MCQVDLLGIYGSCNFEYIISYVKLYSFVANINLVGLTLYLIHHSGCRGLLIFVIFIVFILIIIGCVMWGSTHAVILPYIVRGRCWLSFAEFSGSLLWCLFIKTSSIVHRLKRFLDLISIRCWIVVRIIEKICELRYLPRSYRRCTLQLSFFTSTTIDLVQRRTRARVPQERLEICPIPPHLRLLGKHVLHAIAILHDLWFCRRLIQIPFLIMSAILSIIIIL